MQKKRVLILCLHRPDRSPSQRFRFEQYLPFLSEHGYEFDFSYLLDAEADRTFYRPGHLPGKLAIVTRSVARRLRETRAVRRYDLAFVQREAFMLGTAYFERAIGARVPLIFDFDDAIWMQVVSEANRRLAFLKDASKTASIIRASALVFAGNEFLAAYARQHNPRVAIVPTTIDTQQYRRVDLPRPEGAVCIGWSGSFSTIEHFRTAIPALRRVRDAYGSRVTFKIIGDGSYHSTELDTHGEPWRAATEVQDLSAIDVGIMPLPDTEWARGKCGLKGLQYMALGIPTLMSPVGVNQEIIQPGVNGYLPATEDEWVRDLSRLVEDAALRARIGAAGRETVERRYSVDANRHLYLQYFDQLSGRRAA